MTTFHTNDLRNLKSIINTARCRTESQHHRAKVVSVSTMGRYFQYALDGHRPSDERMQEDARRMEEAEEQMELLEERIDRLYEVENLIRELLGKLPSLHSDVILTCEEDGEISQIISLGW